MKKWMSILAVALVASAFLAGCGPKEEEGATPDAPAAEGTQTPATATEE